MRKNKLRFIAVITLTMLIAVIWFIGCVKQEITNEHAVGSTIVCFGDSITFGYGAQENESYPVALSGILKCPVINAGVDGDTSKDALARIDSDVLSREPFLVVVEFGGNDFIKKVPVEETLKNMEKIITTIQSRGAMVAVVDISAGILLRQYHRPLYILARRHKAIYVPSALCGIITNPRLKSDFIHPNGNGYAIIAKRVYKAILPYLPVSCLRKSVR